MCVKLEEKQVRRIDELEEAIEAWSEVWGENCLWGCYREVQLRGLKEFVESSLWEAVSWKLGAGWYKRGDGRRGCRSGSYMRTLATPHRAVEIEVPWLREGNCEHKLWDSKGMLTSEAREAVLETYLCVLE